MADRSCACISAKCQPRQRKILVLECHRFTLGLRLGGDGSHRFCDRWFFPAAGNQSEISALSWGENRLLTGGDSG